MLYFYKNICKYLWPIDFLNKTGECKIGFDVVCSFLKSETTASFHELQDNSPLGSTQYWYSH